MGMDPAVKFFSDVKKRFWIKQGGRPLWRLIDDRPGLGGHRQSDAVRRRQAKRTESCSVSLLARSVPAARAHRKRTFMNGVEASLPRIPEQRRRKTPASPTGPTSPSSRPVTWSPKIGADIQRSARSSASRYHDRLFFAGEHTQMDFFGYMEGALRSGERAAHSVMLTACGLPVGPAPKTAGRSGRTPAAKTANRSCSGG